jgi:heat-inducible transcriptional repressor
MQALYGLVELYIQTAKPVGSQTLQENGFQALSSATLRNYLVKLEEAGYLKQLHTSGGRIPTGKGIRAYIETLEPAPLTSPMLEESLPPDSREVAAYLSLAAEGLSELTSCAVFLSAPRFDQDFVQEVRLIALDPSKVLAVLITDFGQIRTETIYLDRPADERFLRSTEEYFRFRLGSGERPLFREALDAKRAQRIYNETMVRHLVGYANFPSEDLLRTGFSKLLAYPELSDPLALASSLSLLENGPEMRRLLKQAVDANTRLTFIGEELMAGSDVAAILSPYKINQAPVGAIGILGPMRLPYRDLFALLEGFTDQLSRHLTDSLYKFKITYREPSTSVARIENMEGKDHE